MPRTLLKVRDPPHLGIQSPPRSYWGYIGIMEENIVTIIMGYILAYSLGAMAHKRADVSC